MPLDGKFLPIMSTDGETNGDVEGSVLSSVGETGRDIRNHMLFEISTEAANRGMKILRAAALRFSSQ